MPAACLLLAAAILGGTMLTFLFDQDAPLAARIAMGACLGPALLASLGFALALWLGLNAASIALSGCMLLLPFLLLLHPPCRARVLAQYASTPAAPSRNSSRKVTARTRNAAGRSGGATAQSGTLKLWLFYAAIAILLGLVFNRAVFERPDGIFTGIANNLGDLPLHLQVIHSFTQGQNLPPEDPTYAGVRFAYPFLVDFLAAMLVRSGANVLGAIWLQNVVMGMALVGSLHYWTLLLTRNRRAGILAPLLVLFSGGLGWWLLFSDPGPGGFFSLPHDYTILSNSILRWGNSLTTLFVPQRSILFGIPVAIFIFIQWWNGVAEPEPGLATHTAAASRTEAAAGLRQTERSRVQDAAKAAVRDLQRGQPASPQPQSFAGVRMAVAGTCAGLLPLIHAHTFLVVMAAAVCWGILFPSAWRRCAIFFAVALPLSLPEIFWLAHTGGVNARSFLGWQPGWDHGDHNALWFWFVNAGPFILVLLASLLWRRADLALPRTLLRFYVPFAFCFIVPNLVKVAPWVWDNVKVLFLWYVASAPLVALLLAKWWGLKPRWRWLAPVVFASMVLAGGLDVLRAITGATEYREFSPEGIAIAKAITAQSGPKARVLHAPTYNTPVFLTGRRSLLGYPGWMWSRGLDSSQRERDVQRIYAGGADALALLRQYRVNYVLVGPEERAAFRVNDDFLSQYKKVAEAGPYRLYQITIER